MSDNIVVFPGKRPAHFLRSAIAARLNSAFIPPRIFSADNFIEFLYSRLQISRKKPIDLLDSAALLYEIHLKADKKLGSDHYTTLSSFLPVGLKLFGELEEVVLADMPERKIREVLGGIEFPKFHSLSHYYEEFYREVERRGMITRSAIYLKVAENIDDIDLGHFKNIVLAGFYAFTNVEKKIFIGLGKRENTHLFFQSGTGLDAQMNKLGIATEERDSTPAADPVVHFYKAPDSHGQVFALAYKINERIIAEGNPRENTAIILPFAGTLFSVIHHVLSILPQDGYNIALGYPLERTPVYGFLNSLMKVAASAMNGKISVPEYLNFILHPYTKSIRLENRSDVTRILFHSLEEYLVGENKKISFELNELEDKEEIFTNVSKKLSGSGILINPDQLRNQLREIHGNTISKFAGFKTLKEFASRAVDVLAYVSERSTAQLHPYFRPYMQTLIESLEVLAGSLVGDQGFEEISGYFAFIRSYVAVQSVAFSGTPLRGLQVLGLLETRNLKFDTLYILDANDDVIPGSGRNDMLLPQPVRQMLGIETYRDREKLAEYYFELAVNGAREVHIFYSADGKKEKSRFVEKLLWKRQRIDKKVSSRDYEKIARYGVRLANSKPVSMPKKNEIVGHMKKFKFSATALDSYLRCQLQFYYRNVLSLQEKAEVSEDMDQSEIGSLVHDILKRFFEDAVGGKLSEERLKIERMMEIIDLCISERYGRDLSAPVYFIKQQIRRQLSQFLEFYQIPNARENDIEIIGLEKWIKVVRNGFTFTGRIDRLEKRGDRIFIIDYKTGADNKRFRIDTSKLEAGNRSSWGDAIKSLQLPVYMLLYSEEKKENVENLFPAYLFLGRSKMDLSIENGMGGEIDLSAKIYREIEPFIFSLVREILDPAINFMPAEDLENVCPKCPYSAICGTQWVKSRDDF